MRKNNKKILLLLILASFLLIRCHLIFADEIKVGVDIIVASQRSVFIDSRIANIENHLRSIFRFSSYELYATRMLVIPMGHEEQIILPEGKIFILSPLYFHGQMIVLKAKVLSKRRLIVDTQFRVPSGGFFLVGGPKIRRGVIILKVTAY